MPTMRQEPHNMSSRRSTVTRQQDTLDSRRASLAQWRSTPMFSRKSLIGDPLPPGWAKASTEDGTPYYVNHQTRETQWTDPRLEACLLELNVHDDIRFAAYRTAVKMRDIQVYTRLSKIHLSAALNAFYTLDLTTPSEAPNTNVLTADQMATVLLEVYAALPNPYSHVDILVSWLLHCFDKRRTGKIGLTDFKTGLALLSVSWLEEKYRFLFGCYDMDRDGFISRTELARFIKAATKLAEGINEAYPFLPNHDALEQAVNDCCMIERERSGDAQAVDVSLETFLEWAMKEPRCLVWIPTMHRVAATENVKHETACCVCKMYPIIGFRYRSMSCMDKDVCQDCFWTGREGNGHKITHKLKEYCFPPTAKEDSKDFSVRMKNKLSKVFKKKKKDKTEVTAEGLQPVPYQLEEPTGENLQQHSTKDEDQNSLDRLSAHLHDSQLQDEHDMIRTMAAQLGRSNDQPVSTMVVSLDTEQKLHLLRVIDELDAENRHLLRQVMEQQEAADEQSDINAAADDEARVALERRVEELSDRNRQLIEQLNHVKGMLETLEDEEDEYDEAAEDDYDFATAGSRESSKTSVDGLKARLGSASRDVEVETEALAGRSTEQGTATDAIATSSQAAQAGVSAAEEQRLDSLSELDDLLHGLEAAMAQQHRRSQELGSESGFQDALSSAKELLMGVQACALILRSHLSGDPAMARSLSRSKLTPEERASVWGEETMEIVRAQEAGTPLQAEQAEAVKQQLKEKAAKLRTQLSRLEAHSLLETSHMVHGYTEGEIDPDTSNEYEEVDVSAIDVEPAAAPGDDAGQYAAGSDYDNIADLPSIRALKGRGSHDMLGGDMATSTPVRLPRGRIVESNKDPLDTSTAAVARAREEIERTAGTINKPRAIPRSFSTERMQSMHHNATTRMMAIKAKMEHQLGMSLRGVTRANAIAGMFKKLSNGYLLCKLLNLKLEKAGHEPVRPTPPTSGVPLEMAQAAQNLATFTEAVEKLLGHSTASLAPSYQEMTSWEIYGTDPNPAVVTRLLIVLEELLAQ